MRSEGSRVVHIRPETLILVERVLLGLPHQYFELFPPRFWTCVRSDYEESLPDVDQIRKVLLDANRRFEKMGEKSGSVEEISLLPSWIYFDEVLETIQIYDEGLKFQRAGLLVDPGDVKSLLDYFPANKRDGVVLENHGPGYHFHYGKIRSGIFERTNLLLTFNPQDPDGNNGLVLWGCPHGSYPRIDMTLMGKGVRRPVYEVCRGKLRNHPISEFMKPLSDAVWFFPVATDI